MSQELYHALRPLLGDKSIAINAVPSSLLPTANGITALLLHDPCEAPVLEEGTPHNMKYRAFDYAFRHLEFNVEALTNAQRAERIAQVLLIGIRAQQVPESRMPLYIHVENGNPLWMRAAREFRKQYQKTAR